MFAVKTISQGVSLSRARGGFGKYFPPPLCSAALAASQGPLEANPSRNHTQTHPAPVRGGAASISVPLVDWVVAVAPEDGLTAGVSRGVEERPRQFRLLRAVGDRDVVRRFDFELVRDRHDRHLVSVFRAHVSEVDD